MGLGVRLSPHPWDSSAVGNALYDASGRRTSSRGPTRRERTTRRTVSYKVSGPDASGMYDASYSVVQGVVQHRTVKKQIGQNGAKWVQMRFHFGQNSPKGETSNIGTSRLQHADSVYN